jgi:hypothetical protein
MTEDVFTEPDLDPHTLANLGPLTGIAGVWEGSAGADVHPVVEGSEADRYVERYELEPIDPQTNGPQFFYGLRYHKHITKPGEVETFHDQVGYWLWNPAEGTVTLSIAIPRGQVALASGQVAADATTFTLRAERGLTTYGICSNPFLEHAYTTRSFTVTVTVNADGTWAYDEDTVLQVLGRDEPFHHTDRHTLHKVGEPAPNPRAR